MSFSPRQLWILARSGVRCARAPRPRPSWSFLDAVVVSAIRAALIDAIDQPAPIQRKRTSGQAGKPPASVRVSDEQLAGMRARRFEPKNPRSGVLALHFHGGGYVIGGLDEEGAYVGRVAEASGVTLLTLEYRLAPEHVFPAAVNDAVAAVQALLDAGQDPKKLVLLGDSAGGGLALAALLQLRDQGAPQLAGASLGSPAVDLSWPGATMRTHRESDFLTPEVADKWMRMYLGDADIRNPLASPSHGDHIGLPPLQYLVGDSELFYDDVIACAETSKNAGVEVEVVIGKDACHCWYRGGFPPLPGSRDTVARIADFIQGRTGARGD
jgi:acetyl esterase/lipase